MKSIWTDLKNPIPIKSINNPMKVDVAIIGGGMAGILTAYQLRDFGLKVIVIEKNQVGQGITGNTTAKITSQHGLVYQKLLKKSDLQTARQYARYNEQAIKQYHDMIKKEHISCHFEYQDAYLYDTNKKEALQKEAKIAKALGISADYIEHPSLPFATWGAAVFHNQAQFHPLEFLYTIGQQLEIYQNTQAIEVKGETVTVLNRETRQSYAVTAKHIVVATHYPFINLPGFYFLRIYQSSSYVLALKHAEPVNGMYRSATGNGYSLSNYEDLLLFGGARHRTGVIPKESPYETLRRAVKEFYPKAIEVGHWSAEDCMPLRQVPYIGYYTRFKNNLYISSGFQKWGMTSSMAGATLLANHIKAFGTLDTVFSPQNHSVKADFYPIAKNMTVTVKNLVLPGTAPRCSHLRCSLKWNLFDQTWDCPCHGSKYTKKGRNITNPAKKDLKL